MPTTTNYIWDEDNLLAEADGTNSVSAVYSNEPDQYGNLISSRISNATSYHHFDGTDSTRQLSNSAGVVTDKVIYDAWGNVVNRTGTTRVFYLWVGEVGYYFDVDTGLFSVRERPYEPANGRWTTVDPLLFVDAMNRYGYARSSPVGVFDASGRQATGATKCKQSNTTITDMQPTGGTTDDPGHPGGGNVGIRIRTHKKELGPCGAFKWTILWDLRDPAPDDASWFILQHVKVKRDAYDCCTHADVTSQAWASGPTTEYWEAFVIPAGFSYPTEDGTADTGRAGDKYANGPSHVSCSYGYIWVNGEYCLVRDDISKYPDLKTDGVADAGGAPSSYTRPDPYPKCAGGKTRNHSINTAFKCCDPDPTS